MALVALTCLLAGAAAGWFLRRMFDPAEKRISELERRLADSESALQAYRREVTEHFRGTAERVNRLTEDYRELHAHLSDGAISLCDTSASSGDAPLLTSLGGTSRHGAAVPAAQPLDYAPARAADDVRTSEDLDLERIHDA
jgi:uncharacterized membrane-anchored protein YhcB (DUF1043 family)